MLLALKIRCLPWIEAEGSAIGAGGTGAASASAAAGAEALPPQQLLPQQAFPPWQQALLLPQQALPQALPQQALLLPQQALAWQQLGSQHDFWQQLLQLLQHLLKTPPNSLKQRCFLQHDFWQQLSHELQQAVAPQQLGSQHDFLQQPLPQPLPQALAWQQLGSQALAPQQLGSQQAGAQHVLQQPRSNMPTKPANRSRTGVGRQHFTQHEPQLSLQQVLALQQLGSQHDFLQQPLPQPLPQQALAWQQLGSLAAAWQQLGSQAFAPQHDVSQQLDGQQLPPSIRSISP